MLVSRLGCGAAEWDEKHSTGPGAHVQRRSQAGINNHSTVEGVSSLDWASLPLPHPHPLPQVAYRLRNLNVRAFLRNSEVVPR